MPSEVAAATDRGPLCCPSAQDEGGDPMVLHSNSFRSCPKNLPFPTHFLLTPSYPCANLNSRVGRGFEHLAPPTFADSIRFHGLRLHCARSSLILRSPRIGSSYRHGPRATRRPVLAPASSLDDTLTRNRACKSLGCHCYDLKELKVLYLPLLQKTRGWGTVSLSASVWRYAPWTRGNGE